jgi:hypothetical protein
MSFISAKEISQLVLAYLNRRENTSMMVSVEQVDTLIRNSCGSIKAVMDLLIDEDKIGFWDAGAKVTTRDNACTSCSQHAAKYIFLKEKGCIN